MHITLIPSVGGGIGHIARTAILARAIHALEPSTTFEYVLDTERLRPFNIEVARRTGFPVTLLPPRPREVRDDVVRHCLGHADMIIEDTARYLIPYRQLIPDVPWISIPLFPLGDELFLDWPLLAQVDAILWAYAPLMECPPELDIVPGKVVHTGPFFDLEGTPTRATARKQLGFEADDELIVYAPRGMPFGLEFGQQVLAGLLGAVDRLRATHPRLQVALLAVRSPEELRLPDIPDPLPEWVRVVGVLTPAESACYAQAADLVVSEGTSTTHEAAALGTPILMVPGPIRETWLLGTRMGEQSAAHILWIETVTPESVASVLQQVLEDDPARVAMITRADALIAGGGGVSLAARHVIDVHERHACGRDMRDRRGCLATEKKRVVGVGDAV